MTLADATSSLFSVRAIDDIAGIKLMMM